MASNFPAADPEAYEAIMGRWSRRLAPPFIRFAGVRDGQDILDVGCGTGSLAFTLPTVSAVRRVEGIDFAQAYVDWAAAQSRDPRLSFRQGDACDLPYADGSFDAALSMLVLQFVPDAPTAVAEMRRVVRPGGIVAACLWDGYGGQPMMRMFWDTAALVAPGGAEGRRKAHFRPLVRQGELAGAFRSAGLDKVEETLLTIRIDFENFADYWSPFERGEGPIGQYVAQQTPDMRDRLREAVRAAYESGEPDGTRSFAASAFAAKGTVPAA